MSRAGRGPLSVWMNGVRVGTWTPAPVPTLSYAESWLASPLGRGLSLSLPLLPGSAAHRGPTVAAWFDNLLPDSPAIRDRLRQRFGLRSATAPDLLRAIGRDCVGAVQVLPLDATPGDVRRVDAVPLTEGDVARLLRATATATPPREDDAIGAFRISIAGAQEKTALLQHDDRWMLPQGPTPTTHLLKLPLGLVGNLRADLADSVENEWLCLRILAALGLPVAEATMRRFADDEGEQQALVVRRFDRAWRTGRTPSEGPWVVRLPQEDLCQATGTAANDKYESDGGPGIPRLVSLLRASAAADADLLTVLKAQLAFWLLAAPDGHAKNFSIFLQRDGFRLTPLYDVLSAWPLVGRGARQLSYRQLTLAMALRGSRPHRQLERIQRRHWQRVAASSGVPGAFEALCAMVDELPRAIAAVEAQLPADFPAALWSAVQAGLLRHRDRFVAG